MPEYTDQMNHTILLGAEPQRIVSLVPSQSELLWDLGLQSRLVGITKFCIHPNKMFRQVSRVGGTKTLDIDKIRALKPDLIIGNKEENEQTQIELLKEEFNVWMSDIYDFDSSFEMMRQIGIMCGKENEANQIIEGLRKDISTIKQQFSGQRVAYFIWNQPYMLAGKNTFIDFVLTHIGLHNVCLSSRYPEADINDIIDLNPQYCLLSSEPFPFKGQHVQQLQQILPQCKILIVDGEMFSWYGSRLRHLKDYITNLKLE